MPINAPTITAAPLATFTANVFSDTYVIGNANVGMVALDLIEGRNYTFDLDNTTFGDLYLRLFDQFGAEVRGVDDGFFAIDNDVENESPYLEFVPNFTGRYYVAISPFYLNVYDPFTTAGRPVPNPPLFPASGILTVTQSSSAAIWGQAATIGNAPAEGADDLTDKITDDDRTNRLELIGNLGSLSDIDISRLDLLKGDLVVVDVNGDLGGTALGTVLRVFTSGGAHITSDDDSGFGEDPELVFTAFSTNTFFFGISGEGNAAYNAVTGAGAVNAVAGGDFEVIIHRNPTQIGSEFANAFTGDDGENYIVGRAGNDTVNGNAGNDTLAGGDDQDSLTGGDQGDVIYGEHGNDTLFGGKGNDVLSGGLGADTLDGGAQADLMFGGAGDDTLSGGSGTTADTLHGDAGNDLLSGQSGNDLIFGGDGLDTLSGGDGGDLLSGGNGNDSLTGAVGLDTLDGGVGDDTLEGGNSDDSLLGGFDNDVVLGGGGVDRLDGGAGLDTLTGGAQDDVFVFTSVANGLDIITDFTVAAAAEVIDLSVIFDSTGSVVTLANFAQFIQVTPAGVGADTFLGVDANGATGGLSFTVIAQVVGVTAVELFDIDNFLL
jgi:Ca2+-binding RTX toxin-like protein